MRVREQGVWYYLQIASLINELQAPTLYVEHEKALQVPDELANRFRSC